MEYRFSTADAGQWVKEALAGASLGDRRRTARAQFVAEAWMREPGQSLPALFERIYDLKAAYTFFDRPETTPDNLQAGHRAQLAAWMAHSDRTFLLLEDTTDVSWSGHAPVCGLGPIGTGAPGLQGFRLHSVLAVTWPGLDPERRRPPVELLGLADQQYEVRTPAPPAPAPKKDSSGARSRRDRARESQIWARTTTRLGPAPSAGRWVRVSDRESDIFEYLQSCAAHEHGYVVRAVQNRVLVDATTGQRTGLLIDTLRQAPAQGHFPLFLRARKNQPARVARLSVAGVRVTLRPPQGLAGPAVTCTAVRVFEAHPDPGVKEPLEWLLLTDAPDRSFEGLREVVQQYATRWLIEEFHKALKTGVGAERLQLETKDRLWAAIGLMSLVAVRLVDLKERAHRMPDAPAQESGLTPLERQVLAAKVHRPLATVRDVALALGRLGGHLNRPSDGLPGWQTLWRGYRKLHLMVQGVQLAQEHRFGV